MPVCIWIRDLGLAETTREGVSEGKALRLEEWRCNATL